MGAIDYRLNVELKPRNQAVETDGFAQVIKPAGLDTGDVAARRHAV